MKVVKLFTKEQIESNLEIKKAIRYGEKKGYNVNEYIMIEPKDYEKLINNKEEKNMEKYNNDGSINANWLAKEISIREGKKVEVDIGQIKEVLKYTLQILSEFEIAEVEELLMEYE